MLKTLSATICALCLPLTMAEAESRYGTIGSSKYIEGIQLTDKLTRLRDVGGYTTRRATACISLDKYEQYLRASWGAENFRPTEDECWPTKYNQKVRATGRCSNATSSYTTDNTYKTFVCEFEMEGWFSSNAWISVVAVEPK